MTDMMDNIHKHVAFHHCYCDQHEALAKGNKISQHSLLGAHGLRFSWDDHTEIINQFHRWGRP